MVRVETLNTQVEILPVIFLDIVKAQQIITNSTLYLKIQAKFLQTSIFYKMFWHHDGFQ